jgi:2-polyprenyl-3-methyl-5-hydroxy-6-metoxy-1,4-benzoquinol methylase
MARALDALRQRGQTSGRVLDFGSYFGNFAILCARLGYQVDALDSYAGYGDALQPVAQLLGRHGVRVLDSGESSPSIPEVVKDTYDAILCMGVIEHIPHTPRPLLESINSLLKPNGWLVLDTPNLAYLYRRLQLARGDSTFCPIHLQYFTEIPFEGHHREYTRAEIEWMLRQIGHEDIAVTMFNYTVYGNAILAGEDLENYLAMERDPDCRELILTASRKAASC